MSDLNTVTLTSEAARVLTEEVKADAAALWAKLLELYEGGAHKALGYSSWGAYYEAEFGQSKQQGHRILDAARVVAQLGQSPIGDSPPSRRSAGPSKWSSALGQSPMGDSLPSERVARELVPVLRDDPERVEEVWAEVVEEHGPTPTAKQTREVVLTLVPEVEERRPLTATVGRPIKTGRDRQMAEAAKRRAETVVGQCQAFAALPDIKVEQALLVATPDEIKGWSAAISEGTRALIAFRKRLYEG